MSFFKNCCEWACARIVVACYANDLISVASTEHLLSRPVREVIEAGIHEKMYRQKQLFNKHGYNLAIFKGGHVKGKNILVRDQAWATSGPRATYGPPSTLVWPASYI